MSPSLYSRPGSSSDEVQAVPEGHPERAKADEGEILFYSWNIGGKPVDAALTATENCKEHADIFAFQELPRREPGWHASYVEQRTLVQYRGEDQWRGNGVCFPTGMYSCIRRKASDIGVWLRLRDLTSCRELWVCSTRLSTGVSDDVTADEIQGMIRLTLPSIILVDKCIRAAGPTSTHVWKGRPSYLGDGKRGVHPPCTGSGAMGHSNQPTSAEKCERQTNRWCGHEAHSKAGGRDR